LGAIAKIFGSRLVNTRPVSFLFLGKFGLSDKNTSYY